ncbi:putative O-acetyl-ADP-ribose deacetylase 1-like [Fusobacterium phage vB_FnuS_FNU3]|uniref:O-acetyl-ADP-ribose deacetylase 1-like protein n=1 Tax=Fusobacterium phage Fnu1 TaxID=2530024 RepID=A0A481W691_9CAUD|nr:phosphatase [Fusobacterium phage Fnu1]QBJ04150.1 O-acetyl-ADP-ribose deacetylase 1-like protein [Fusobacterium phage Fnu1]WGH50269.1 putative O-acetyl-ADP-ribose deacetylase 1-like [Fusobacterium phage vB_FnuS_FNU2]WGH50410.1 putative O-acetyl-ADP-ribose deacetylase 1-like [Fusobacterium phage vB_FnuS_FNU3]
MKMIELKGDLFTKENMQDKNIYLAQCISRDCEMGLGIAKTFDKKFPDMKDITKKSIKNTTVCSLYKNKVFNLITKNKYWQKPTYISLENSLKDMAITCKEFNIKILAMPRIACGLDKLNWNRVKVMLEELFKDLDITIYVYVL